MQEIKESSSTSQALTPVSPNQVIGSKSSGTGRAIPNMSNDNSTSPKSSGFIQGNDNSIVKHEVE